MKAYGYAAPEDDETAPKVWIVKFWYERCSNPVECLSSTEPAIYYPSSVPGAKAEVKWTRINGTSYGDVWGPGCHNYIRVAWRLAPKDVCLGVARELKEQE